MKPETERILSEALMWFSSGDKKDVTKFVDGLNGIESYWQKYLERMGPYLPQGLIQKTAELTSVEGLLQHSLLQTPLAVARISLFDKLKEQAQDNGWSHSEILAVCGITQEQFEEEFTRRGD